MTFTKISGLEEFLKIQIANLFTERENKANKFAYMSNMQPANQSKISLQCKQIFNTL